MKKKGKKNRISQLEAKYDLVTEELQKLNVWRRNHLLKHNVKEDG